MDQNNVNQGTAEAIRAAFELQYAMDAFDRQQHDKLIQDFAGLHELPTAVPLAVNTSMPVGGQAAGGKANLPSTGSGHGRE